MLPHRVTKSYNFDPETTKQGKTSKLAEDELRASNGNIIALTGGPLKKPRYINQKIELELIDFKKEIAEKFKKSLIKNFRMPRLLTPHYKER